MANTATVIVVTAGTITFANEWYQTKNVNWKVPLATIIAALLFEGLSKLDDKAAVSLSVLVLLGALTAKFNGQSAASTIAQTFSKQATPKPKQLPAPAI